MYIIHDHLTTLTTCSILPFRNLDTFFEVVIFPSCNVQSIRTVHLLSLKTSGGLVHRQSTASMLPAIGSYINLLRGLALTYAFNFLFLHYNVLDLAINNILPNTKALEHFAHQVVNMNVFNLADKLSLLFLLCSVKPNMVNSAIFLLIIV